MHFVALFLSVVRILVCLCLLIVIINCIHSVDFQVIQLSLGWHEDSDAILRSREFYCSLLGTEEEPGIIYWILNEYVLLGVTLMGMILFFTRLNFATFASAFTCSIFVIIFGIPSIDLFKSCDHLNMMPFEELHSMTFKRGVYHLLIFPLLLSSILFGSFDALLIFLNTPDDRPVLYTYTHFD